MLFDFDTRACSWIFKYSALCPEKYLKLLYIHSWYMIPNMIIERWLVFKISKYSHKILWLGFKIFKHCHRTLWSPARCIKYSYKSFISLIYYHETYSRRFKVPYWTLNCTKDPYRIFVTSRWLSTLSFLLEMVFLKY